MQKVLMRQGFFFLSSAWADGARVAKSTQIFLRVSGSRELRWRVKACHATSDVFPRRAHARRR
jgi:hypothetical protein